MSEHLRTLLSQVFRRRSAVDPTCVPAGRHLAAAIDWIRRARAATADGGIAAHFHLLRWRWAPAYPETTGYTIPTLMRAADALARPDLRGDALSLADYLLRVRTPEGGVGHWSSISAGPAIVFDTGQALFGWLAAYRETAAPEFLGAARQAADWLVAVQAEDGSWRQGQHLGVVKVIDTRVAWALLETAQALGGQSYTSAARRNLDWALSRQEPDGWFRDAGFSVGSDPYTHNIAYVAEGLLEAGLLLGDDRYVCSARLTAHALLDRLRRDGGLPSKFDRTWRPRARSSCLVGNCQAALLWLRLYDLTHEQRYLAAARRAIAFVASTQEVGPAADGVRGGIAGSWPIFGEYERLKYPNWAAKFFADAVLALQSEEHAPTGPAAGWAG